MYNARVLLFDDQPIVAEGIRRTLVGTDIEFFYCPDPTRAIDEVRKVQPTVILLDLVMPAVDGLTVLRFLRRSPDSKDIPVVVLSSKEEATKKADAFAQGANDYLVKLPDGVELAARIRYHSQAYANLRQLRALNDELALASQAKSRFLARLSHELRTPMNGVLGMVQLMLGGELPSDHRRYLEIVNDSARSLLTLLNDLLDFSKIEAGKLDVETVPFDLVNLVDQVAQMMGQNAMAKGLEMAYRIDPSLEGTVRGDPTRLRQILTNMLGNSVKFTEQGSVTLSVTEGAGGLVHLAVKDTGIGIPESARERIFQAFGQADSSTTRRFGGTGLGLPISKKLAEAMGGDLDFHSVEGQGTTFTCSVTLSGRASPSRAFTGKIRLGLPRGAVRDTIESQLRGWGLEIVEEGDADWQILAPGQPGWSGLGRSEVSMKSAALLRPGDEVEVPEGVARLSQPLAIPRLLEFLGAEIPKAEFSAAPRTRSTPTGPVLLAEDNPINQVVATELLELLGYHARLANNGLEAVQAMEQEHFAVVLMDCDMPELDGYEATARIRGMEGQQRRTPIIAMTAHAFEGAREACLAAGMDDYISKPIDMNELEAVLLRWTAAAVEI